MDFGISVIKEMNRLGIIVDVSHLNEVGFWDVLQKTKDSLIASHSNCKALSNHYRNLTDQQIVALAKKGGVINLSFCGGFIKERITHENLNRVKLDDWLDHVDYVVELSWL